MQACSTSQHSTFGTKGAGALGSRAPAFVNLLLGHMHQQAGVDEIGAALVARAFVA